MGWIHVQQIIGAVMITAMVTVTLTVWAACLISGLLKKRKKSHPLYVTETIDFEAEVKAAEERRDTLMEDWKEGKI